jgi:hypothetical protein
VDKISLGGSARARISCCLMADYVLEWSRYKMMWHQMVFGFYIDIFKKVGY